MNLTGLPRHHESNWPYNNLIAGFKGLFCCLSLSDFHLLAFQCSSEPCELLSGEEEKEVFSSSGGEGSSSVPTFWHLQGRPEERWSSTRTDTHTASRKHTHTHTEAHVRQKASVCVCVCKRNTHAKREQIIQTYI